MKILVPFVPHLARECLEKLGDKKLPDYISWEEEEVMYELAKFFREKIKDML